MKTYTFAEFQASGRDVDSVQGAFGFRDGRNGTAGRTYADNGCYLERTQSGGWSCTVSSDGMHSDDLAVVELFLFKAMDGEAFKADFGAAAMNDPEQYMVAFGNPEDGFKYVGPFGSFEEAETYGYNNERFRYWWVILLQAPASDVAQP